jgi:hypothetical protein
MAEHELQVIGDTCIINQIFPMPIAFRPIASLLARSLRPAPVVDLTSLHNALAIMGKVERGMMITVNHYSEVNFGIWWAGIIISSVFPVEIHWITTSGWTGTGWFDHLTKWLFPFGAKILGFFTTPAMPPDPSEAEKRALAVRKIMSYTKKTSHPVIGIFPEGGDTPGGILGELPSGVGRFMHLLSFHCPQIIPVGIWKDAGIINIKFGAPYHLEIVDGLSADERDNRAGEIVMQHIAGLLPIRLRGSYKTE